MPRLSLLFPAPSDPPSPELLEDFRTAAEDAGHDVEILVAAAHGSAAARWDAPDFRTIEPDGGGLTEAVILGLDEADGELLVLIDPRQGYVPADLLPVLAPLLDGRAEVAIGSRHLGLGGRRTLREHLGSLLGRVTKPLVGTTDPLSGLIALSRSAVEDSRSAFRPLGDNFSLEVLSKVGGRWADVPIPRGPARRYDLPRWDDIRHLKRLADHRFGNLSRLVQFCVVGASGMVVDLTCYAIFQAILRRTALAEHKAPLVGGPLDLAVAGLSAILIALTWNFFLNRRLTFNDARGGPILRQYLTYALSNALGISLSLSLRLLLPRYVPFFNAHRIAAALVGIVTATGVSFGMARWLVFNPKRSATEPDPDPDPKPAAASRPQSLVV